MIAKHSGGPTGSGDSFGIVGVGASAGGLEAFTDLLHHLPADTGMAFVLVQHLDPDHESVLAELLGRTTPLPVIKAKNNTPVQPNHVYSIPPNTKMTISRGILRLVKRRREAGPLRAIDVFLESLAADRGPKAIGVILSGTGADGTLGLEAIKNEGGITLAQSEDSAKYDSMPRSAIASGCVDIILPPDRLAKELAKLASHLGTRGDGLQNGEPSAKVDGQRKEILRALRTRFGVDFTLYKPATIDRRIARRVALNKLARLEDYVAVLRRQPEELDALFQDLLVNVTSFLRDTDTFLLLRRKIFPKLLQGRSPNDPVRIWVAGCSCGQEAFSMAMVFLEVSADMGTQAPLQIFATDINDRLIDKARLGLFSKAQMEGVSPEQLRRFFVHEDGGFRICKPIRSICVFAKHDLTRDPPFSKMDLVSCRNVLIYLEPPPQAKIMSAFHYALKPEGILLLGKSESVGGASDLFETADRKHKLYTRKSPALGERAAPESREQGRSQTAQKPYPLAGELTIEGEANREADRVLLADYAPAGVLVNEAMTIVQFRGQTGRYLEPTPGKVNFHLLKMLREGLTVPLRKLIEQAGAGNRPRQTKNVAFRSNDRTERVNLRVIPLRNVKLRFFLILFERPSQRGQSRTPGPRLPGERTAIPEQLREVQDENARLRDELSAAKDHLRSVTEEYEAANEELQASNEESQSSNEDLQSINEEVETTKEELESTNEELLTVNEEMLGRNTELHRINNDLNNILAGVQMCIVVLDTHLAIRRFTPLAEKILNLVPTDVGRPITNIRPNFEFLQLDQKIRQTIDALKVFEEEIQDTQGRWFSLRIFPYRTSDNKIDGALLILVDVDVLKVAEQRVRQARDYAEGILRAARNPLLVLRPDLRVNTANDAFYKFCSTTPAETEGHLIYEVCQGLFDDPKLRRLLEDLLPCDNSFSDFELTRDFQQLGKRSLLLSGRPLETPQGAMVLLTFEDITEHRLQAAVRSSETRYRRLFETAKDGIIILDQGTWKITDVNPYIMEILDLPREELLGRRLWEVGFFESQAAYDKAVQELENKGSVRREELRLHTRKGGRFIVDFLSNLYEEAGRKIAQCNIRDSTERVLTQLALRQSEERFRTLIQTVPQLVWTAKPDGEIDYLSPQWLNYTGGGRSPSNEQWLDAINPVDRAQNYKRWQECIKNGTEFRVEQRLRSAHGQFRWFQTQAVPLRDRAGAILQWVGSSTDIQIQKENEEKLRQARDQLRAQADELELQVAERTAELRDTVGELESFSYSIAHDLRAPLRTIHGFAVVLQENLHGTLDPENFRHLEQIARSADRLDALIRDVLEYAKILRSEAALTPVDVRELLADLQQSYSQFQPPAVSIAVEGDFPRVCGNPALLSQCLTNLLGNAIKFVAPGAAPQIRVWAEERRAPEDNHSSHEVWWVRICVRDNGIGIAPENHRRIFRMFERVNSASEFEGTGIGLTIVRKAAERMGGRVGFDSQLGLGSTFWVELRRAD